MHPLWQHGRRHLPVLLLSLLAMGVLGLSTGALAFLTGPALHFVLTGGAAGPSLAHRLLPHLALRPAQAFWALPLAIVAIAAVKGLGYLGQFYFSGLFGQRVVADVRRELFSAFAGLSPVQLTQQRSGDLLSRFTSDVAAVELAAVYAVASYLRDGLQVLVLVAAAFLLNWRLALGAFALAPVAAVPVSLLTRVVLRRTREAQVRLGTLGAQLKEGLSAVRTLQAFGAYEGERQRFLQEAASHRRALTRAGWARGTTPGVTELFAAGALAAVLAWVLRSHAVKPEQLVSFLTVLILLYQPAKDLGRATQFMQQAQAAWERISEVLSWHGEEVDAPGASEAPPLVREVALERVRFRYGERSALDGFTWTLPLGKVVALVGPSGAGKSTVTSLLLRFIKPQQGRMLMDGEDVQAFTVRSVRRAFALVTQEPLLLSATVLDNLRLSKPDASLEEVTRAAQAAQADAFIRALPQGYDTPLGERGLALSGGQRQRLCLARALLSGAPVLILDEATSNLDPESEREVKAALAAALQGRTALVIAHRLSAVVHADRIDVVEDGRITESGTHAELLARQGTYARLWSLQERGASEVTAA